MSKVPAPEAIGVPDGEVVIFDQEEFRRDFGAYAAMVRNGALYVLPRGSQKWVNVEQVNKSAVVSVSTIGDKS